MSGALRPGSEAHKREVCRMFHETFNPYRPSIIAWPKLSPEELQRVTSLPIWDVAVHTESRARLRFATYANSVDDPEVRAAIVLNAWEEGRHKEVLAKPRPGLRNPAGKRTAVSASSRSAVGLPDHRLLRMHRQFLCLRPVRARPSIRLFSGRTGGDVRARHPGGMPPHPAVRQSGGMASGEPAVVAAPLLRASRRGGLGRHCLGTRRAGAQHGRQGRYKATSVDSTFTASSASAISPVEIDFRDLMALCLKENDRRFAGYDPRLLRPTTVPRLVRFALWSRSPGRGKRRRRRFRPRAESRDSAECLRETAGPA